MISEYCPWALACLCVFNAFSAESETDKTVQIPV